MSSEPDRGPDRPARRPLVPGGWGSLRTRVTFVASLGITAAVVLGLLLMYLLQTSSVRRTVDSQLRTYAQQIAQSPRNGTWPNPLPPSALDPNAQAQVLDVRGNVLAATRTLAGVGAVYVFPAGAYAPVRQEAANGALPSELRVVALRTTETGRPVTVVAGTSTALLHQVNVTFARHLVIGLPVILVLAAAAVWLIVGRALRPVERIREAVTQIRSADLSLRVPVPSSDDEIGHLARTMNDMLGRLETSTVRQRRFVADASHELRSPLAAIRTTLEVGLAHPAEAPWPTIAARAGEQSQRLEDLIRQLLFLAKADERTLAPPAEAVDVGDLLMQIRADLSAPGISVEFDLSPDATTTGDAGQLRRLFGNIIDNALRHALTRVTVASRTSSDSVRVTIADDGPGIPPPDRARVFDRFVRLDHSRNRTTGSGNSGLGLAIADDIARAHGGSIAVVDGISPGASLQVILPRCTAAAPGGT